MNVYHGADIDRVCNLSQYIDYRFNDRDKYKFTTGSRYAYNHEMRGPKYKLFYKSRKEIDEEIQNGERTQEGTT